MRIKTILMVFLATIMLIKPGFAADIQELHIALGEGEYPPWEISVKKNNYTGFHLDLIRKVGNQLGWKIIFTAYPWSRAVRLFEVGEVDAITFFTKTEKRSQYALFIKGNELSVEQNYLIANKDAKINCNGFLPDECKQYSIVTLRGYSYGDEFDHFDFKIKGQVHDFNQLTKVLLNKRYDLAIISMADLKSQFGNSFGAKINILMPPIKDPVYIAFSKKGDRNLVSAAKIFAKSMIEFKKSEAYLDLLRKYELSLSDVSIDEK